MADRVCYYGKPCLNFLTGYCPKGSDCADTRPKFELPPIGGPDDLRGIGKKLSLLVIIVGNPDTKFHS